MQRRKDSATEISDLEVVRARRIHDLSFFFQAEDGIRDGRVTGVQTCALPIFGAEAQVLEQSDVVATAYNLHENLRFGPDYLIPRPFDPRLIVMIAPAVAKAAMDRSEERRVGKECGARGWRGGGREARGVSAGL